MAAATILNSIRSQLDLTDYRKLHKELSFAEYLDLILDAPGSPAPRTSGCTTW